MDSFQTRLKVKTIKADLQALPKGLDAYDTAYDDAMARIFGQEKEHRELAGRVLALVLCATRPLATPELQHALMVEPGDSELDQDNNFEAQDLLAVCAGLITIDENSKTIRFVHYTTQEYLQRKRDRWLPRAQFEMARTCLDYLSLQDFALPRTGDIAELRSMHEGKFFFATYTLRNGLTHLNAVLPAESSLNDDLISLLNGPGLPSAIWSHNNNTNLSTVPHLSTVVHLISHLGLEDLAEFCIANGFSYDSRDESGRTPLSYAAEAGKLSVMQLLIKHGAAVDTEDLFERTPLLYSAMAGHESAAALLLDHDALVSSAKSQGQKSLVYAAQNHNWATVRLLIEHGAAVDPISPYGRTPLSYAAHKGPLSIVRLLISKGADPMRIDRNNQTPAWYALVSNKIETFRYLLGVVADRNGNPWEIAQTSTPPSM